MPTSTMYADSRDLSMPQFDARPSRALCRPSGIDLSIEFDQQKARQTRLYPRGPLLPLPSAPAPPRGACASNCSDSAAKDAETLVLCHLLAVLRRQPPGRPSRFTWSDHALVAVLAELEPRQCWVRSSSRPRPSSAGTALLFAGTGHLLAPKTGPSFSSERGRGADLAPGEGEPTMAIPPDRGRTRRNSGSASRRPASHRCCVGTAYRELPDEKVRHGASSSPPWESNGAGPRGWKISFEVELRSRNC